MKPWCSFALLLKHNIKIGSYAINFRAKMSSAEKAIGLTKWIMFYDACNLAMSKKWPENMLSIKQCTALVTYTSRICSLWFIMSFLQQIRILETRRGFAALLYGKKEPSRKNADVFVSLPPLCVLMCSLPFHAFHMKHFRCHGSWKQSVSVKGPKQWLLTKKYLLLDRKTYIALWLDVSREQA